MKHDWRPGNRVELLENGEQFYPAVFGAMARARREVYVETFIVEDDEVGRELQRVLIEAARRGVACELVMDGYGSEPLPPEFIAKMTDAGVRVKFFDPQPRWFGSRINIFRRLHRKVVLVDAELAFVGGINFQHDHVGPPTKQDYAVALTGPVVRDVYRSTIGREPVRRSPPIPEGATVLYVNRDNRHHTNDIEQQYRLAIRLAKKRILIANAYFFPGYRFLRDLYAAAQRGVDVQLIMQGNPDLPFVRWAGTMLYSDLRRAGVVIHEYVEGPLHAKVAVIDDDWSTVGSSNLDPLSLFLNIEANAFIHDREFNKILAGSLTRLIKHHSEVHAVDRHTPRLWRQLLEALAFHIARHLPRLARLIPGRRDFRPVPVSKGQSTRSNKEIAHGT